MKPHKGFVGVDIDGVMADTFPTFSEFLRETHGICLPAEEVHTHDLSVPLGVSKAQVEKYLNEFYSTNYFRKIPSREYAFEGLLTLFQRRYDLSIVTSRPSSLEGETREWVDNHFPPFFWYLDFAKGSFESSSALPTKASICLERRYGYLIEDSPENALEVANSGVMVFLMNHPWNNGTNHAYLDNHPLIKRVKGWREISESLK